jgi:hypothetical protein
MGDGPLTKAMLEEMTVEWHRWRAEIGEPLEPVAATKSVTTSTKGVVKGIIDAIAPVIVNLEKQVSALQARVEELERKGYVGIWKEGKEYSSQSECTHDGARWISHKRTNDKPGTSADWSLMEKSEPRSECEDFMAVHVWFYFSDGGDALIGVDFAKPIDPRSFDEAGFVRAVMELPSRAMH